MGLKRPSHFVGPSPSAGDADFSDPYPRRPKVEPKPLILSCIQHVRLVKTHQTHII